MADAAPIKQMLLTVQFEPVMATLNVIDLTAIYGLFSDDYPIFNQVNRAGPMDFRPEVTTVSNAALPGMPRLHFLSSDLSFEVFFQEDRISVGWKRSTPFEMPAQYPGFEEVLKRFAVALDRLGDFIKSRFMVEIRPVTGEIAYIDVLNISHNQGLGFGFTKTFRFMDAERPLPMTGINLVFNSELHVPGVEGYMQTSIAGPEMCSGQPVALMQNSSHFNLADLAWDDVGPRFLAVRGASTAAFHALVNPASYAISAS